MQRLFKMYLSDTRLVPTDIFPMQYGEEACCSSHTFGPCIRNNYIIHYVYSGAGRLRTDGISRVIKSSQAFLICPGQLAYYGADSDDPWHYRWIEFNGSLSQPLLNAAGLSSTAPVYNDPDGALGNILKDIVDSGEMSFEELMSKFWMFIFRLTHGRGAERMDHGEEYVRKAESYIKTNLHRAVTVADTAAYAGIDRCYLSRLFKEHKNTTPRDFIISLKMNKAARYLQNPSVTISEAAQAVGFSDTHSFTRSFKNHFSMTPSEWRKKFGWEQSIRYLEKADDTEDNN